MSSSSGKAKKSILILMTGAAPLVLLLLGQQKYAAAWTQPHASCCLGMGSTYASSALGRLSASRSPVAAAPLPRPSINSNSNSTRLGRRRGSAGGALFASPGDGDDRVGGGGGGGGLQGPGGSSARAALADRFALGLSAVLILIIVVNRLLIPPENIYDVRVQELGSQTQSDLIAVAAITGLALNSISEFDVTSREAEQVTLKGVKGRGQSKLIMDGT